MANSLTTIKSSAIGADSVDGTKLADNALDSEHYTDGSVDHVHLAGDAVDGDNIADDSINSEHYVDASIDHQHLADDCVDGDNIADNAVGLAALAHGTDGNLITFDASGAPAYVATGNDGQVLTSTGAGSPPAFETISSSDTLSHRNIIVNGACQVAQRGDSSTANKFLVDRWRESFGDHNEAPTQSWHALTSSDTGPWEKGFRRSYHVQNGNQTDAVGAADRLYTEYRIEAQDIANSGWDYHEPTSYLTMQFWVKASVAQTYYVCVHTFDGTAKQYSFAYTVLANTWTHVTHSIPGHTDLTFDDNSDKGMTISFEIFLGTNYTHSGATNESWRNSDGGTVSLDQTSTVWSTNDSTWEATGFQLEVGSTATAFEHRTYQDELNRCRRYYQRVGAPRNVVGDGGSFFHAYTQGSSNKFIGTHIFPVDMTDSPSTVEWTGTVANYGGTCDADGEIAATAIGSSDNQHGSARIHLTVSSIDGGKGGLIMSKSTSAYFAWEAEV